jgi:hypothetical protein
MLGTWVSTVMASPWKPAACARSISSSVFVRSRLTYNWNQRGLTPVAATCSIVLDA